MPAGQIEVSRVCVLTVTYGDRVDLIAGMIRSVMDQGVRQVAIYANGLERSVTDSLHALLSGFDGLQTTILSSPKNVGPATAYAALIRAATDAPKITDAVLLMDDDNLLQVGCLSKLLQATDGAAAVCGVRTDRRYIVEAAEGGAMSAPANGEAYGFDLRKRPKRFLSKVFGHRPKWEGGPVPVPHAPYGGLLVPRVGLEAVAGPREDFCIYADDYDYSQRLAREVGLFLVPGASIDDQETSWNATQKAQPQIGTARRLATSPPDFRLYFALRNALVLDKERVKGVGRVWFAVNLFFLGALTVGHAFARGRRTNVDTFYAAVTDALAGRLGPNAKYPLP